jgi:hypothetical protein
MESEYFAATAIHAGALQDKNEFKFIDGSHRKIPLAIWVGTNDQFFPLSSVRATRDALMAKGFPVEVTEMPGHDHWYYDLAPQINEAAWQFLRKYALPAEPHFESYAEVDSSAEVNRAIAEVNKVLAEINVLKARISDLITAVNAKEAALNAKDFGKDRSEINKIAQEETDLLKEAAAIARSIADKASQVNAAKLEGKYPRYLELVAQHNRKYASMLDVMAEQAATLLGNESFEVINARRAEARKRIEALRKEADDLYNQAEKIVH